MGALIVLHVLGREEILFLPAIGKKTIGFASKRQQPA
jgi:hypothetical protein